jgi:Circularly permutated YpsA SLOG family
MLDRIITGGQTGCDQAGWRAARATGIPTGGAMPRGFLTEAGPRPEFATQYGAHELESPEYPTRTLANVRATDATVWFGSPESSGGVCTLSACRAFRKPYLVIGLEPDKTLPSQVAGWLAANNVRILNVAGNRKSRQPGLGARVEVFLGRVIRAM